MAQEAKVIAQAAGAGGAAPPAGVAPTGVRPEAGMAGAAPAAGAETPAPAPQGPVVQVAAAERPEITVTPPPPSAQVNVAVPAGALVHLDAPLFHPDVARYVVDGEDLVVVLANGAIVRLDGFFAHPDQPPQLTVVGGPPVRADDLLAAVPPGATEVEPAAGGEAPAGPEHGGGAGFSPFDPGDIGQGFAPTGPLPPTALGFPAGALPEVEPGLPEGARGEAGRAPALFVGEMMEAVVGHLGPDGHRVAFYGLGTSFGVSLQDDDSTILTGAEVRIVSDPYGGTPGMAGLAPGGSTNDFLGFAGLLDRDGDGVVDGTSIHYVFDGDTLVLWGADTLASYAAVLSAVRVGIDPAGGEAGARVLSFTVTDDQGLTSPPAQTTVFIAEGPVEGTSGADRIGPVDGLAAVDGGWGNDWIRGGEGSQLLYGGPGRDCLGGGGGPDVLDGGACCDGLRGGEDADLFVLHLFLPGVERILDFDPDQGDRLFVPELLETPGYPGPDEPGAEAWLRLCPTDADGDGVDDAAFQVDPDGPGSAFGFSTLAVLVDTPHDLPIDRVVAVDNGGAWPLLQPLLPPLEEVPV